MRLVALAAAAGTVIGTTSGWLGVMLLVPSLVRHSGHYGSHIPPRLR